jgi:hypothetical protein
VAWSAYTASGQAGWLVAGMAYAMSKYVFFASNTIWHEAAPRPEKGRAIGSAGNVSLARRVAHLAGHADVRWHAWIVLAVLGWLRFELIAFAAYYALRAVAGALRKARGLSHA